MKALEEPKGTGCVTGRRMSWCSLLFDQLRYLVLLSTFSTHFFNLISEGRTYTAKSTLNSNKIYGKYPNNECFQKKVRSLQLWREWQ